MDQGKSIAQQEEMPTSMEVEMDDQQISDALSLNEKLDLQSVNQEHMDQEQLLTPDSYYRFGIHVLIENTSN